MNDLNKKLFFIYSKESNFELGANLIKLVFVISSIKEGLLQLLQPVYTRSQSKKPQMFYCLKPQREGR